ncbi:MULTISPECIES: hypothetical protein [Flavobacterium]|uniref:Uncharacterized protein n=2 Tax=Flavobacterium TaxID=237 RepID=A0A2N9PDW6_9FLAO|nr:MULTISPECIES: hypothetical protein [Flavobacterium]QYS89432.1 hypothetical protein JJC05_03820 [Flavobacterium davisii]RVU91812.1 hypothetical protein EH230_02210 [Flavobacterium columnare]SPE78531.1 hypothetical protein FLACOL_02547 [Flavobacterium columnare]
MKKKILLFSPVRKSHEIVALHLRSLLDLDVAEFNFTYSFFDDNLDPKSSVLLQEFVSQQDNALLLNTIFEIEPDIEERKERWELDLYNRITLIKDRAIQYFLREDYDFLFFVDADLVLHPQTINHLFHAKKDFIAEIFWTHFSYAASYMPNCWDKDGNPLDRMMSYRIPGTYEVGFTGACTLLTRKILSSGVRFQSIKNMTWLGEDKHFCTRAAVMDFDIFINTESPAFHIYSPRLVFQAKQFIDSGYSLVYLQDWLNDNWIQKIETWYKANAYKKPLIAKIKTRIKKWIKYKN